jgi:hypothetical protein
VRLRNGLPAVTPDRAAAYAAAAARQYHSFCDVPEAAWPLFLSGKQYLHMLDGKRYRRHGVSASLLAVPVVLADSLLCIAWVSPGQGCLAETLKLRPPRGGLRALPVCASSLPCRHPGQAVFQALL